VVARLGFTRGDENPDQPTPTQPTPTTPESPLSLSEVREDCLVLLGQVTVLLGDALERSRGPEAEWTDVRLRLAQVTRYLGQALDELEYVAREES
jgi:hypothetical protein